MGWIGGKDELFNVLRIHKVDQDEDGKYRVDGQISSFMGAGEEFVVGDDAVAYVEGKPHNICNMLEVVGVGQKVKVI